MKQILLRIEQTNNGELEKGEYSTGGRFLEMKYYLMKEKEYEGGFWGMR